MKTFKIAIIQNNAGDDWEKNLLRLRTLFKKALRRSPHLIALPETFYYRGSSKNYQHLAAHVSPKVIAEFKHLAKAHRVAILLGSILEGSHHERRFFNTSVLISENGRILRSYRKIHLFDSGLLNASVSESDHHLPGKQVSTATVNGVKVGLSICYDLRFPELYRALSARGARILFVPANFTEKTGKAHWEVLLKARAIENQAFVIAPGQVGRHPSTGILSFGTSLVIDPWGEILARASRSEEGVLFAELDLIRQKKLQKVFPVLRHRRL